MVILLALISLMREGHWLKNHSVFFTTNETILQYWPESKVGFNATRVTATRFQIDLAATSKSALLPPVLHFPAIGDDGIEMRMELEGLQGSHAIQLIDNVNASLFYSTVVWLGSPIPRRLCNTQWIEQALEYYNATITQHQPELMIHTHNNHSVVPRRYLNWTIHLLDWSDSPYRMLRCPKAEQLVGPENVRYWKRSIVKGRDWMNQSQTIKRSYIPPKIGGVNVRPLHLATRTDVVQGIENFIANLTTIITSTRQQQPWIPKELSDYIVTKDRPGNVIHHWPISGRSVDRGSHKKSNCMLRTTTSQTLLDMMLPPYNLTNVFCGMQGVARDQGRASVNPAYIESLLHYKIMVVTQRDVFEGHLRLFEGLVSGAMVIHDRILSMPIGLEEQVNIVFFDTQQELRDKVLYYLNHTEERLAIARRGRQLAMCQSRTWHRMEQIILGKTMTPCDE
jgi:hypothetical protein